MSTVSSIFPNRLSLRETLQNGVKTVATIGAKAVASAFMASADKTAATVERFPRSVAAGGVVTALAGLSTIGEYTARTGVAAFNTLSTRLGESLADQPAQTLEIQTTSSASGWFGLGMLAAGATLTAIGFRSQAAKEAQKGPAIETAPLEYQTATVWSTNGEEFESVCTYDTWHEQTFSRPYQPTITERLAEHFDAWVENKIEVFKNWRDRIHAAHQAQTQSSQIYNPFPQTTNYIGEPLLPNN